MSADAIIVLCTLPGEDKAAEVARTLVDEKLIACANLVPRVRSIYRWQDKVEDDTECLAVMKTTAARWDALRARVVELHPYECPEVLFVPIAAGHPPYLAWVAEMTDK